MASVGLILGGGAISGAAYEFGTLMALEMATGWNPNDADVIVGTSAGAFVAATVRSGKLSVEAMVREWEDREQVVERIRSHLYRRRPLRGTARWLRRGLLPGLIRPGLAMVLGSPGRFGSEGVADWLEKQIGEAIDGWPERPTLITALELESRRRVVFGTTSAPRVSLRDAVAASSAVPLVFEPHSIEGRRYVDGGVMSGTHADLVLGNPTPLDLLIVLAPMAAEEERRRAWFYEGMFDRVGTKALDEELSRITDAWPDTELLTLRPVASVLEAMRPNPLSPATAVPTFVRTLSSMRRRLASPEIWPVLERHLIKPGWR